MRSLTLAFALALSFPALAAEYEYVIPMSGYAQGHANTWFYAPTFVRNLSPRPATVRTTGVYPLFTESPCRLDQTWTVEPHERTGISLMACGKHVAAISISSTERLSVWTEIDSHRTLLSGWDKQIAPAATSWIAANVESVAEGIVSRGQQRANVLLINPSDRTLTVQAEVSRPEFGVTAHATWQVPPRSAILAAVNEIADPTPPPMPVTVDGRHEIRLRADGPYQAGVSTVAHDGSSMYLPFTPLEP